MTPQALKASILQLATQGKLVPQRPEEGTAEELYQQIQAEKQRLIAEGSIKRGKALSPIKEDEIPFDIPETWKWVRFAEIANIARGGSPRPIKQFITDAPNGINWIKIGDTDKGGKYINHAAEKIIPEGVRHSRMVHAGDFLLTNSMSYGRPYILNIDGCVHDGWLIFSNYQAAYDKDFLYYLLSSPFAYIQFCGKVSGAVVKNLNIDKVLSACIPLPPLEEQKRIVAKIEEMLPLIDRYGEAYTELETFNKRFPDDLRKSILQEAIQGKLVPQLPEESTAEELYQQIQAEKQRLIAAGTIKKEKSLPPIEEKDLPFDIPETWKWVYLGEIFAHNTGKAQNASAETKNGVLRKFITTSNLYWDSFDFTTVKEMLFSESELDKCSVQKGDLLVCEGGDVGRSAIWPYEESMCIQNHIHKLRAYVDIEPRFFYYFLYLRKHTGNLTGRGVGIKGLSSGALHSILCPLPPLAEQQRIVAKIKELLTLCKSLQ